MLLAAFLGLTLQWRSVFRQPRLLPRAQRQALGALLVLGRATLSRILWANGREQHSWSAEYFLHSRAKWDPQDLFLPLLKEGLSWCPRRLVGVAVDDTDENINWHTAKIFYGGKHRKIRYKRLSQVLWQRGGRRRLLTLFVIAPTAYRKRQEGRLYYRDPAYLLCTDCQSSARRLLQIYFDRWQIEVNHREEKDTLGVGQAQLWNPISVPKQPALVVAAYSAIMLAALRTFGPQRGAAYQALPKWRRAAKRPSCLDLITLLRKEVTEHPELLQPLNIQPNSPHLIQAANA